MMKRKLLLLFAGLLFQISEAQPPIGNPPNCGSSVPYFYIDMTGSPDSIWLSPSNVVRNGLCCGGSNPDRYVYFEILLDANTAMVEVDIFTGAEPPGSGRYKVDCGPEIIAGQPVCIAGPGLHHIVFYKPGGNANQYYVRAIPKPTFPNDDTLRMGCSMPVEVLGLENGSISWSSIYPGATDDYNSYLSCTDCAIPTYTPGPNAPNYVDYRICGNPIADECGYVAICDTVRLYNFDSLSVTVTPNPASFCSPGSVLLSSTVVGGDTPYQYTWRDPSSSIISTSSTATATTGGTHLLEVRDRFYAPGSCPAVFVPVSVSAVAPPTIDAGLDQTLCPESPSAFLTANYSNATGVIWTGGAGTYNPSNTSPVIIYTPTAGEIASGSVTLTATVTGYGAGCSVADDQVTITFPPPIIVTMLNDTVLCFGDMGTLTPVVTNGTGSLTYAWNTGATSATLNASAGNYCVNVTDDLGCVGSSCANIIAPSALTLIMSSTDVSSDLALDGTATGTPGGGTAPYTYLWNNGQTTQTATGLGYGIYTVTVTDANGCTISSSVVVNKPSCIAFQASVTTSDVTCFGAGDGTASVNILGGGSGNYSYSWSPPIVSVSSSVSGLDAGAYLVTVTDNIFGCLEVVSFVILEPTALTNTMNSTNVTTIGGNDGTATANPLGGTPGYSYLWSTGATTQGITGLVAGTYTVTIIDLNFCSLIDSVKINQPPCDNLMITSTTTSVSCNGGTDGSATAFVLFGNAPFAYLWNTGATTQGISGVAAGTYTVTITDDLNCTAFLNINIIEPSILSAAAAPTNPQCFDTFDGTIELNVVGGTYPYSYQWSNGIMVEDLYNLGAGTFTVTVSDAKGCFTNAQATLTAPLPIDANALVTNITCFNGSDGEIDLTVSGGVLPYFYNWNTGATTEDIVGIDAGTYTVTVTDGNGCVNGTVLQFYVNQPADLITDTVIVDCPIPGASTALVTVVPSGGSGGSFFVSFDNGSTFLPQGDYDAYLPTGNTYQIVVKDSNDCVSSVSSSIYVYPTLVIDSTDFNPCFATAQTTTEITVYVSGGRGGAYQLSFDNGGTYNAYGDYTHDLSPGQTYYIIARDSSGCQSDTLVLAIADSVHVTYTVSNFNGYNISCYNAEDAWIDLTVTGGLQPYTYVWSDASTTQDLGSLKPGFYYVYIYDSNGCKDSLGFNITEPPLLTFSSFNPSIYAGGYNISCNGETDGSIDIQLSGGVPSYTYQWNTGATSEDINNIPAGTYTISVLDQNGCSIDSTITLTEPPVLSITSMVPSLYAGGYNITC
ncbi:MAG: SprB repeat-containing protein, partial [Candidatus Competibacteraceae bacterium]|nr:SprB repeat-containing protein [Candidatus Competibacteraceae bacterium]